MPSDLCHDASASSLGKRRPTIVGARGAARVRLGHRNRTAWKFKQGLREALVGLDPNCQLLVWPKTSRRARGGIVMGFAATPDAIIADQIGQVSTCVERFLES